MLIIIKRESKGFRTSDSRRGYILSIHYPINSHNKQKCSPTEQLTMEKVLVTFNSVRQNHNYKTFQLLLMRKMLRVMVFKQEKH